MRPDGVALKDHSDGAAVCGDKRSILRREDFLAGDKDFAFVGFFQARDAPQGCCFAAARRTQKSVETAFFDIKRNIVDGFYAGVIAVFENFYQRLNFNHKVPLPIYQVCMPILPVSL